MCKALLATLLLIVPAFADSELFQHLRTRRTVELVLPGGECRAKVVNRTLDRLTLRLSRKSGACGPPGSLVTVSEADVRRVVDNRPRRPSRSRDPELPPAAFCAIGAMSLVGAPSAFAIGEGLNNDPLALAVFAGTGIAGALICHDWNPRYTIFAERITPVSP